MILTGQNQSSKDLQQDRSHEYYARRDHIAFGAGVEGELAYEKGSSWSKGEL
jgi:hypothetical protein